MKAISPATGLPVIASVKKVKKTKKTLLPIERASRVDARSADEATLEKFRTIATALGKNPTAMLAECAQGWLNVIHEAVNAADANADAHAVARSPSRMPTNDESPFEDGDVDEVRAVPKGA